MNDQQTEALIKERGADVAPRVTLDRLEALIKHTEIVKHVAPSGQILRWAVLTCANGFAVAGRPSVAASPANDNEELGRSMAIQNAKNELWPLLGYELKTWLSLATDALANPALTQEGRATIQSALQSGDAAAIEAAVSPRNGFR